MIRSAPEPFQSGNQEQWNAHIGSVWAMLLERHQLDRAGCVVEIGPGFADKLAVALRSLNFQGTLFLVEPNRRACHWATQRYRELLPDCDIVAIESEVAGALHELPASVDALLLNHVLDDLILNAGLPPSDRQSVFGDVRALDKNVVTIRLTWKRLLADGQLLATFRQRVLDELNAMIAATNCRLFGASQYESWFLRLHELNQVNTVARRLLRDLAAKVGQTAAEDQRAVGKLGQKPDTWLFSDRESL